MVDTGVRVIWIVFFSLVFAPWSSPESVSAHSGCLLQNKNGQQDKRKIPVHRSARGLDHMVHVSPGERDPLGTFSQAAQVLSRPFGGTVSPFPGTVPLGRKKRKRHCFAIRCTAENRTLAHQCSQKERKTRSSFFPFRAVSREG
jgi:hypothetical protein